MRGLMIAGPLIVAATAGNPKAGDSGPWDVHALRAGPKVEVVSTVEVEEGGSKVSLSQVLYDNVEWMGRPTRVFAYYARPVKASGRIPGVILAHGGGGKAFPHWARMWAARGYAALAPDFSGEGPNNGRIPDGGPEQSHEWKFQRLKEGVKSSWCYQAVAAVIRGVSALRSMPDVDESRIGMTGISWGGYLTCIAMSLDDRIKAAVPVYGCGFLHENSSWVSLLSQMPELERQAWIDNFEPSRYLPRRRVPVLWMNGTNDSHYPLDSYQKSYRAAAGPRTLCVTVNMPHGHEPGWARNEIAIFMDSVLKPGGSARITRIRSVSRQGNEIMARFDASVPVVRAELHWTVDLDKAWADRKWETAAGVLVNSRTARAVLPEKRPLVYFMTLTDSRGAVVSSEHEIDPQPTRVTSCWPALPSAARSIGGFRGRRGPGGG